MGRSVMEIRSGIKFEEGSGRYDAHAEVFHFSATDDDGVVPCGISQEAFEDLSREVVNPMRADGQFAEWEQTVFDLARAKYEAGRRQTNGAVVISTRDVADR